MVLSRSDIVDVLQTQLTNEIHEDPSDSFAFLNSLIYKKNETSINILRKEYIKNNEHDNESLRKLDSEVTFGLFKCQKAKDSTVETLKKSQRRRLSVDFHTVENININDKNDEDEDENLSQLRNRLLGNKSEQDNNAPLEKQLEAEEIQQEDHLEDMLSVLSSIREGAQAFNDTLMKDGDILKAAEQGLDMTKNKLMKSGDVLRKLNVESIGVFTALKFGVGCLIAFLLALICIKLLPKW